MANHGMLHYSELVEVEVDYSFLALIDILDVDIGWGPHLPSLQVHLNYGRGEVVQGRKPKRQRRVVIEEKEYEALLKVSDKVAHLESLLNEHLKFLGPKDKGKAKMDENLSFNSRVDV